MSDPHHSSSHPHPHPPRPRHTYSERRTRPRLTEQIQIIRELWLLREQARVQAAERCFLTELERLLSGRSYSSLDHHNPTPPPPCPPSTSSTSSTSTSSSSTIATSPPRPPPPPTPPLSTAPTVSFLDDGLVFESNPPPRGDHAPARERPGAVNLEMEQARASQRVTNLSAEFRARLEGNELERVNNNNSESVSRALSRSHSHTQLSDQRAVSSLLDSQFRHHLERVLHERRNGNRMRHMYRTADESGSNVATTTHLDVDVDEQPHHHHHPSGSGRDPLERLVTALREEVNILRNVVNASFDLQLDIQRSIRQEVAAAMSKPATLSLTHNNNGTNTSPKTAQDDVISACSSATEGSSSSASTGAGSAVASSSSSSAMVVEQQQQHQTSAISSSSSSSQMDIVRRQQKLQHASTPAGVIKAGMCTVCLEQSVDSLLYACGHMCTCSSCGRQLLASGLACPICRAPVRDVVRAFVVTE